MLCYVEQVGDRRILKTRRSLFTEPWKMICGTTESGQKDVLLEEAGQSDDGLR